MKTWTPLGLALGAMLLMAGCTPKSNAPPTDPKTPTATPAGTASSTPPKSGKTGQDLKGELMLVKLLPAKKTEQDTEGLKTSIQGPVTSKAGESIKLHFLVRNPDEAPRTFCDYHSPFEGIRNNIFEVKDAQGKVLPYQGMMAKRAAPSLSNFWTVPPKSKVRVLFDLSKGYTLPAGSYTLRFSGNGISGLPASESVSIQIL